MKEIPEVTIVKHDILIADKSSNVSSCGKAAEIDIKCSQSTLKMCLINQPKSLIDVFFQKSSF